MKLKKLKQTYFLNNEILKTKTLFEMKIENMKTGNIFARLTHNYDLWGLRTKCRCCIEQNFLTQKSTLGFMLEWKPIVTYWILILINKKIRAIYLSSLQLHFLTSSKSEKIFRSSRIVGIRNFYFEQMKIDWVDRNIDLFYKKVDSSYGIV